MLFHKRPRKRPPFQQFRRPGVVDFLEGYRGVLVKPEWFDAPFFDLKPVTWAVDDIWLSGHLARRAVPIWALAAPTSVLPTMTSAHFSDPLLNSVIDGHDRLEANCACVRYFQENHRVWL